MKRKFFQCSTTLSLSPCKSPNVSKGTFQTDTHVYLILKYVCGGEIYRLLRSEKYFINDVALFYIVEIILAISHMHSFEIAYRDIKPENLLIDQEGHI